MSNESPSYRKAMMDSGRAHWHGGGAVPRKLTPDEKAWLARQPDFPAPSLTQAEREQLLWDEELAARNDLDAFYEDSDDE